MLFNSIGSMSSGSKMSRQQKALFKSASTQQGRLQKKSTTLLVGWQTRYFKIIADGQYLVYYDKPEQQITKELKPKGVINISQIEDIVKKSNTQFQFKIDNRLIQLKSESSQDCDVWITCLTFLANMKRELNDSQMFEEAALNR